MQFCAAVLIIRQWRKCHKRNGDGFPTKRGQLFAGVNS